MVNWQIFYEVRDKQSLTKINLGPVFWEQQTIDFVEAACVSHATQK